MNTTYIYQAANGKKILKHVPKRSHLPTKKGKTLRLKHEMVEKTNFSVVQNKMASIEHTPTLKKDNGAFDSYKHNIEKLQKRLLNAVMRQFYFQDFNWINSNLNDYYLGGNLSED